MSIKTAIKFDNGMVMVFDGRGRQVPEYQGKYDNVKDLVLMDSTSRTKFLNGTWGSPLTQVKKEDW